LQRTLEATAFANSRHPFDRPSKLVGRHCAHRARPTVSGITQGTESSGFCRTPEQALFETAVSARNSRSAYIWTQKSPVNWKSVRDVDNEGYHVAMAHPALQDLYGATYFDEPFVNGVSRSFATYNPHAGRRWSVREYMKLAPEATHLPEHLRKAWIYYGIFPNNALSIMPESVQFYQEFPLSTGETLLRGAIYRYKDETREQAAARYLAYRIDPDTMNEDVQLSVWANESMLSEAFEGFCSSDLEYGVRTHHDHLRRQVPVLNLETAPEEKDMRGLNDALRSGG
jgi:phenylpropionate dioxygenase-like ring-hydroxylating dioxygenase large terminal subunit